MDQSQIEIIRSQRKTIALELTEDLRVVVHAPWQMKDAEIRQFVECKADWISRHLRMLEERRATLGPALTAAELTALANDALIDLPRRVAVYAPKVGVSVGRITIRNQRSRWGSCSSLGNLNFNCLLMLCPPEVRDYVVVHELCHRLELNHSPRFWALVGQIYPQYAVQRQWLKDNGAQLIARMERA